MGSSSVSEPPSCGAGPGGSTPDDDLLLDLL